MEEVKPKEIQEIDNPYTVAHIYRHSTWTAPDTQKNGFPCRIIMSRRGYQVNLMMLSIFETPTRETRGMMKLDPQLKPS